MEGRLSRLALGLCVALFYASPALQGQCSVSQIGNVDGIDDVVQHMQELSINKRYAEEVALGEAELANVVSKESPILPALIRLRTELGSALRWMGRAREAEEQDRIVIGITQPCGPSPPLRDAWLQIFMITAFDGRLMDSFRAANTALNVARALPQQSIFLPNFMLSASEADLAVGETAGAISLLLQAKDLLATSTSPFAADSRRLVLSQLIRTYQSIGDERKVDPLMEQLRDASTTPEQLIDYQVTALSRQAAQQLAAGRFSEAVASRQAAYASALKNYKSVDEYIVAKSLVNLASTYFEAGNYDLALDTFRKAFATYRHLFEGRFLTMTEAEKHQFTLEVASGLHGFYSFCLVYQKAHPELAGEAYSLALWQKTMVADSLRSEHERIASSNDPDLTAKAARLQAMHIDFGRRIRAVPPDPQLPQLEQSISDAERDLSQRVAELHFGTTISVDAVRKSLPMQDAAVEIVRFNFFDEYGATNRAKYCALILKQGPIHPAVMVDLGDAAAVEANQALLAQTTSRAAIPEISTVYTSLPWRAMESSLQGARRIYLATDGILDTTAFMAWKHSDGRYLIEHDEIDLRPVFSTADLALQSRLPQFRNAVLIGNPKFTPTTQPVSSELAPFPSSDFSLSIGGSVKDLPNTRLELDAVSAALSKTSISLSGRYEGDHATKQALLQVAHPTILHLATHGFFLSSQGVAADTDQLGLELSLQRSGLLLAGANQTLQHPELMNSADNGIVSALEIAGLDLRGTELVVLSACDTGLGERGASGEVLGLRRSFHIAGAQRVIASMWQVDDSATATLMGAFYQFWLGGADPYVALKKAAQQVRRAHPNQAYYWAPFVLFGP
jgi:CHAT domain-containing protein